MKITHVVLAPRYSGAEVLVRDIAYEQMRLGHAVSIVALMPVEEGFEAEMASLRQAGCHTVVPSDPLRRLQRVTHIRRALKVFGPDVVFAHSIIPAAYARVACLPACKVVSVLHAAGPKNYLGTYATLSEKILRYASAGIICVADDGAEYYRKHFDIGRPVAVIRNGINLDGIRQSADAGQGHDGLHVILQVGRICRVKGQHLTLEAAAPLLCNDARLRLNYAGLIEDRTYHAEMLARAESLGIAAQVEFLGARADVFALLASADVYVMPSYSEAHSVAMLEALASGVPVVCSRIQSFRMATGYDGVRALDVEDADAYGEAIRLMLAQRRRFSRDLSEYGVQRTAEEYVEFARRLRHG